MKRIENLEIEHLRDPDPDLSYLGRYTNQPSADEFEQGKVVQRPNHPVLKHRMPYFVAAQSPAETGNPHSVPQDFDRMEEYRKGYWRMLGIRAQATLDINGQIVTITSPGLWGIESDSDKKYFTEVGQEELNQLRDTLLELGFTKRQFTAARKAAGL